VDRMMKGVILALPTREKKDNRRADAVQSSSLRMKESSGRRKPGKEQKATKKACKSKFARLKSGDSTTPNTKKKKVSRKN